MLIEIIMLTKLIISTTIKIIELTISMIMSETIMLIIILKINKKIIKEIIILLMMITMIISDKIYFEIYIISSSQKKRINYLFCFEIFLILKTFLLILNNFEIIKIIYLINILFK